MATHEEILDYAAETGQSPSWYWYGYLTENHEHGAEIKSLILSDGPVKLDEIFRCVMIAEETMGDYLDFESFRSIALSCVDKLEWDY